MLPPNLLEPAVQRRAAAVAELRRKVDMATAEWSRALDALEQADHGSSDYLGALDYVAVRIAARRREHNVTSIVVVIGDLRHEPEPRPFRPPDPPTGSDASFKDVTVQLVYPFRASPEARFNRDQIEAFWTAYFGSRGNDRVVFRPFDDASPLLPANPLVDDRMIATKS